MRMMSLGTHFPQQLCPTPFKNQSFSSKTTLGMVPPTKCTKRSIGLTSNSDLASELSLEVTKMNTQMAERAQALKKSKKMLFKEFSKYLALEKSELRVQWMDMCEDDKWGLVRRFVSGWDEVERFRPLSVRCVKEMVDEYVVEHSVMSNNNNNDNNSDVEVFSGLRRIIRLSQKT